MLGTLKLLDEELEGILANNKPCIASLTKTNTNSFNDLVACHGCCLTFDAPSVAKLA